MRKESLKKNSANGVVEDTIVENDADMNGSAAVDADPLVSSSLVVVVMFSTFLRII